MPVESRLVNATGYRYYTSWLVYGIPHFMDDDHPQINLLESHLGHN